MININKEEALKVILKCCKLYHCNLENKNVMFIVQDKRKDIHYIETVFLPSNFLHLTGINIINKNIEIEYILENEQINKKVVF